MQRGEWAFIAIISPLKTILRRSGREALRLISFLAADLDFVG